MSYDDDQPGCMRIHIAERRAAALVKFYTTHGLKELMRINNLDAKGNKRDMAWWLANAGVIAPDYDKETEE